MSHSACVARFVGRLGEPSSASSVPVTIAPAEIGEITARWGRRRTARDWHR